MSFLGGFIATVFRLTLPLCGDLNVLVVSTHIKLISQYSLHDYMFMWRQ